jgi:hypothetical protein
MMETNAQYGLAGRVPSVESLKEMIDLAKKLDPVISH